LALKGRGDKRLEKINNEGLHALYSTPNNIPAIISKRMRWVGQVACVRDTRCTYRVSVGKPEGKRPLERLRRRLEDNVKMDLLRVLNAP
jgi:hypothetical protein